MHLLRCSGEPLKTQVCLKLYWTSLSQRGPVRTALIPTTGLGTTAPTSNTSSLTVVSSGKDHVGPGILSSPDMGFSSTNHLRAVSSCVLSEGTIYAVWLRGTALTPAGLHPSCSLLCPGSLRVFRGHRFLDVWGPHGRSAQDEGTHVLPYLQGSTVPLVPRNLPATL